MATKKQAITVTEEINVLEHLSQGALAWLLNVSPRTIRDHHDLPRDEAGRYDGQGAVIATRRRVPRPELADDDVEKLLVLTDTIAWEIYNSRMVAAIAKTLDDLAGRYGDAGLLLLVEGLHQRFRTAAAEWSGPHSPSTGHAAEPDSVNAAELRVCVICETCKKVRRGRSWVKANPPPDHMLVADLCPKCE